MDIDSIQLTQLIQKYYEHEINNVPDVNELLRDQIKVFEAFKSIDETKEETISEFVKCCFDVAEYDSWLNKIINQARNRFSNFSDSKKYIQASNQLKALQYLINLILAQSKEKRDLEDALVELVDVSPENTVNLKKFLHNRSIQAFLPQNKIQEIYINIVFRINTKFDSKVVHEAAESFYKTKEYHKAVILYISLVNRSNSEQENLDLVELYNSIGCCYIALTQFEDAYKAFTQSISKNKKYAYAHNNLAYSLAVECDMIPKNAVRQKKLEDALSHINHAIQFKNDEVSFYSNKAYIEYELKCFQNVIEEYNYAREFSSNYKELKTLLRLKIDSQLELYYANKNEYPLTFNDLIEDLELIYKNEIGSDRFHFQALDVYYKIKDLTTNADIICFELVFFEFIVNKLMSSLAVNDLNQDIYFYTSLTSLHKLLVDDDFKQPIFCVNHMNDPNEGQQLYLTLNDKNEEKELIQDVFRKNTITHNHRQDINVEYTFFKAFTENEDSLPMWIHYGDSGKGCCIKVSPKFFANFEENSDSDEKNLGVKPFNDEYRLYRVLYLKDGLLVNNPDSETKDLYNDFITLFHEWSLQYSNYSGKLKEIIGDSILNIINRIKYLFKNADYQYEKEMRTVLRRSNSDLEREDIDIQLTKPTSENPIPKLFIHTKKPLLIEEIILGPKLHGVNDLIPYIAMRLLKMNTYKMENVHITKSLIEYR